jgi:hypothetical protein
MTNKNEFNQNELYTCINCGDKHRAWAMVDKLCAYCDRIEKQLEES